MRVRQYASGSDTSETCEISLSLESKSPSGRSLCNEEASSRVTEVSPGDSCSSAGLHVAELSPADTGVSVLTPLPGCPAGLPLPDSSPLRRRVVSVDCGAGLGCEGACLVRSLPDTSSLAVRAWLRFSRIQRSFSSSRCHRGGVMLSNRQPRALGQQCSKVRSRRPRARQTRTRGRTATRDRGQGP